MRPRRTVVPVIEPITLDDLKSFLRIDSSDEDALVTDLIAQARGIVEDYTRRALLTQTWVVRYQKIADRVEIPRPPIQSISSLEYLDEDEVWQTVGAGDYRLDLEGDEPAQLTLKEQPGGSVYSTEAFPWRLTVVAGWESAAEIPGAITACVRILAAALYELRCAGSSRGEDNLMAGESPIVRILRPYRALYV